MKTCRIILPLLFFCLTLAVTATSQTPGQTEKAVRAVLDRQVIAWNQGDIEKFMEEYWKSDSLLFIGGEIHRGWDAALERYKKGYPGKEGMGTLRFEIVRVQTLAPDACLITGKFFLTRKNDSPKGVFTVLFKKKNGRWVIVYDHSSS